MSEFNRILSHYILYCKECKIAMYLLTFKKSAHSLHASRDLIIELSQWDASKRVIYRDNLHLPYQITCVEQNGWLIPAVDMLSGWPRLIGKKEGSLIDISTKEFLDI